MCDAHELIHIEDRTLTRGEASATQFGPLLLLPYKHEEICQMHAVQGDKKDRGLFLPQPGSSVPYLQEPKALSLSTSH